MLCKLFHLENTPTFTATLIFVSNLILTPQPWVAAQQFSSNQKTPDRSREVLLKFVENCYFQSSISPSMLPRIWCVSFHIWSSKPISAVLSLAIVVEILYKGSKNLQLYRRFLLFRSESRPFGVWQYAPHCETLTQKIQISARGTGSSTRNYYDSMRDVESKWVWIEL